MINFIQVRKDNCLRPDPYLFFDIQTLLVDGYISQTFRSRTAERYFLNLLKSTSVPSHVTLSYSEWEDYFFFVQSVPPHIPRQFSSLPGFWLLDRGIVDMGTVVPQRMWSPHSSLDRRHLVERAQLQMPIFFEGEDRKVGISLAALSTSRFYHLRDANNPAPLNHKASTYIRIAVSMTMIGVCSTAKFIHGEYY